MKVNEDPTAPKTMLRLLSWVCPEHLFEEIEGDLIQRFNKDLKIVDERKAKGRLVWNTIKFFRPGIILRQKFSKQLNGNDMWSNYLKVMMRSLARRKTYSAIHVFGLTVGITFALLVGVFIWEELKVNQDLKEVDRLYILESKYSGKEQNNIWFAPAPLGAEAVKQYPTLFENYYRFWDRQVTVSKGDKHFRLQSMIGDSTFLGIFGFQVISGNATNALKSPNSIIITKKAALQYFNRADVAGETLTLATEINGRKEFLIGAVIADPLPKNSVSDFMNMNAQIFLSHLNAPDFFTVSSIELWSSDIITYVRLSESADVAEAQKVMNEVMSKHLSDITNNKRTLALDPLSDYYLVTNHGAVKKLLLSLAMIVGFLLFLAICNFINITIATSFTRLREIGVRKVIGGIRRQIITQFLAESVMMSLASGIFALVLHELLRSYFGDVLGSPLPSLLNLDVQFWIAIFLGLLTIGLLAGGYPSLYLSATDAIQSLKGKFRSVGQTIQFSRGLITIQFVIAIFIFTAAMIMSRQVSFFLDKDLGYDKSFVLTVTSVPRLWTASGFEKMEAAKKEFLRSSKVKSVSLSWGSPGGLLSPGSEKIYRPGQSVEEGLQTTVTSADEDFGSVFGIKLTEGHFFSPTDQAFQPFRIVLNESASKSLHVAMGDKLKLQNWGDTEFTVAGIVADFNYESLHETVKPVAFVHNRDFQGYRFFSFKLEPGNVMQSVQEVESLWKNVFPDDPFVYLFADERLAAMYKTEYQLKKASEIATVLMIIVVLTGVLGLVSLNVIRRNKEIGIRKVLGAPVTSILTLLSKEYAWMMGIAFLLSIPATYFFISGWLNQFAYHIDLQWWMFALPILLIFVITLFLIAVQCLKAALSDPVKSIRYE